MDQNTIEILTGISKELENIASRLSVIATAERFAAAVSPQPKPEAAAPATNAADENRQRFIAEAQKYVGVPYLHGGTSPNGFDCSGFITYLMKKLFRKTPPRTVNAMAQSLPRTSGPVPGDFIIFTHPGAKAPGHIGILISQDKIRMVHASTSVGIQVINVEGHPYWQQRMTGALSAESLLSFTPEPSQAPAPL